MDNVEDWYADVLENDNSTAAELEDFARLADTREDFTEMLATDYLGMGTLVAEHGNTAPATLLYLLELISEDWKASKYIMQAVAHSKNCPPEAFAILLEHGDRYVREAVIEHPAATAELYRRAATDTSDAVRYRLTHDNPAVPDDVLDTLATDREEHIRESARETLRERH